MSGWQFWIDRGGTFTDIVARAPDGTLTPHKPLSENPERYGDAAIAGIKSVLGVAAGGPVPPSLVDAVKMGSNEARPSRAGQHPNAGRRLLPHPDVGRGGYGVRGARPRPGYYGRVPGWRRPDRCNVGEGA